ncbi:MAG TPA: HEPN domain-containing protein [Thermodesulfobacteriota bacterium]|nr:HEPN domain-containing protein [Deltaproteobacteria bacterium]HNR11847.1 HEPN domain-containing protein [Thermodesulfobacteriota bacterium]HNU70098.1 HEPN domain-containing protein [Thermodesulfobacteriota bacterium]HOC38381.1 HEPN domain-containing protein [Thermodesulfobacteriota bacterium]
MEAKEFLDVAQRLCASHHEADRRTSVSRAYYAVFNHIKPVLESFGVTFSSEAHDHTKIYKYLNNAGLEDAESVAHDLTSLRKIRGRADYDMKYSGFERNNCLLWYQKAKRCINDFDRVDKKALRKNIGEYRSKINE